MRIATIFAKTFFFLQLAMSCVIISARSCPKKILFYIILFQCSHFALSFCSFHIYFCRCRYVIWTQCIEIHTYIILMWNIERKQMPYARKSKASYWTTTTNNCFYVVQIFNFHSETKEKSKQIEFICFVKFGILFTWVVLIDFHNFFIEKNTSIYGDRICSIFFLKSVFFLCLKLKKIKKMKHILYFFRFMSSLLIFVVTYCDKSIIWMK